MLPPEEAGTVEWLKIQMVTRVGSERAERYFGYLSRLLSHKLSKPEFNKLCLLTLGRENLPLHNQLIRSILKNVYAGDNSSSNAAAQQIGLGNRDLSPVSTRKLRSGRGFKDRPSPLGPNGQHSSPRGLVAENGDLAAYDLRRLGGPAELARRPQPDKMVIRQKSSNELVEAVKAEGRGNAEHQGVSKGTISAPLGIPYCHASMGGTQRSPIGGGFGTSYEDGDLCHTEVLQKRMEVIAQAQGLSGVTMDCANVLNMGLDAYLKGLISSCRELVGARLGHEPVKQQVVYKQQSIYNQQQQLKQINGVRLGNHTHIQSGDGPSEILPEPRSHYSVSLQDFRVAMELNPQQLGEDWPLLLEKICVSSFEE